MKRIILAICILFAFGCAHCEERNCPSEDVTLLMVHPKVPFPIRAYVPKGFFNEENRDKVSGWQSMEDFVKEIEKELDSRGESI